jgi:cyclophilin family peptidyl-prolyl cis-trans isomerase
VSPSRAAALRRGAGWIAVVIALTGSAAQLRAEPQPPAVPDIHDQVVPVAPPAIAEVPADRLGPPLSKERIILRTVAGDILIGLHPDAAPETVAQLLKLMRAGAYDGTHFLRVQPGYMVQTSGVEDREYPLTPEQRALVHPIKLERSGTPHHRGILSMSRAEDDENSAESSFMILLADARHLDSNYTVFGEVLQGMEVLDQIVQVPVDPSYFPRMRLDIYQAVVVDSPEDLTRFDLRPATPVSVPENLAALRGDGSGEGGTGGGVPAFVAPLLLVLIASELVRVLAAGKLPARAHVSLGLANVLLAGFGVMTVLFPAGQRNPIVALGLFLGLLGLIRLMRRFESAG